MKEKLHIQEFICNLVITKTLSLIIRMHNLYANFVKILDICKLWLEKVGALCKKKEGVPVLTHPR